MILTIKGRGTQAGELPVPLTEARAYFERDLPAFLVKIEDVESARELAPGTFLLTDKPIGGLNYVVTIVSVLVAEWEAEHMKLSSRDFEPEKIKSPHPVVKGFIDGGLELGALGPDRTSVSLDFTMVVELPVPGMLKLMPQGLLQSTADGIMNLKMGATVRSLYQKVLEDFKLPA